MNYQPRTHPHNEHGQQCAHTLNGVTFGSHKGILGIYSDHADFFRIESSPGERTEDVGGLLRAMAKSLCAPPPFVDMDPPEAGNVINSSWNDGNPDHADYFASTGGISAAEARAQLSEWVSRCERAAQLIIAAEALDRKDV